MVQRKVPDKISIQADHVKPEKLFGNKNNLIPSSPNDSKNRGADLTKKKMKKSRSIKNSDFGKSLKSPSFPRKVPEPGKPPPDQQQSPSYMRSTSSFDAKKESPEVSSKNSLTSVNTKSQRKSSSNSSKHGLCGINNTTTRSLTRTSSLKLARTLMKTTSFKAPRASNKTYPPQVILYEDLDVQRATCCSTLKDSKFPALLELNPGGTDLEGTSVLKVCPYTYCSLNGHSHTPLPPLKCFISARRSALKTQRSKKVSACLSPRRVKETDILHMGVDGKPVTNPSIEDSIDFFVEIDAKNRENDVEINGGSSKEIENGQELIDLAIPSTELEATDSEVSDVEWDEGQLIGSSSEIDNPSSDDTIRSYFDEIPPDEIPHEFFEDEGSNYNSSESHDQNQNLGNEVPIEAADEIPRMDLQLEDDKTNPISNLNDGALYDSQGDESLEDNEAKENPESDSHNFDKKLHETSCKDQSEVDNSKAKRERNHSEEEPVKIDYNLKIMRSNREVEDLEESRRFNPKEPNYLSIKPNPEAEKVDLRHQMMDENKNTEEWMLDYALQQAVTKLTPVRKRKVALLVEAFEKVIPIPKYESSHLRSPSLGFVHARPLQACS